jgi:hypothetical protein
MDIDDALYMCCRCMAVCVTATERVTCWKRALCAASGMSSNASAPCAVESVCAVMQCVMCGTQSPLCAVNRVAVESVCAVM